MDEEIRAQLAIVAAQARELSNTLGTSSVSEFDSESHLVWAYTQLRGQALTLLADSPVAKLLPSDLYPNPTYRTVARLDMVAMAGQLATALDTLLLYEPGRLDQLEREKETLQAKLGEAETRAVTILDDELRDRCVDLLLRPGKADTVVRDACVVLEDRLRKVAGLPKGVLGVDLVDQALGQKTGVLVFSEMPAEQQGVHQLYRGVIGFFKNPPSHRLIEDYNLTRARQIVGLVDLLLSLLREAKKRKSP